MGYGLPNSYGYQGGYVLTGADGAGTDRLIDITAPASVAYGVRHLKAAYSGSALKVRRSSDSTELDIGFDGADLDWASAIAFKGAGNLFVTTWYDQSGNGNNLIQATTTKQPQLNTTTERIVFDGTDDHFRSASSLDLSATDKMSLFMVGASASNAVRVWVEHGTGLNPGTTSITIFHDSSGILNSQTILNTSQNRDQTAAFTDGTDKLVSVLIDRALTLGDICEAWVDGVLGTDSITAAATGNLTNTTLDVGSRQGTSLFQNGSMAELVLYPTYIGTTLRQAGESDITTYYGI